MYGGTCIDGINSYTCSCKPGQVIQNPVAMQVAYGVVFVLGIPASIARTVSIYATALLAEMGPLARIIPLITRAIVRLDTLERIVGSTWIGAPLIRARTRPLAIR